MNWPEPSPSTEIEEEEDGPITVVLKEDELEQPIRDLLRSIDETDKIDGVELERIVSVLLAAREMLFEEKRRIEADICLLPQVKEENVSSEESNEVQRLRKDQLRKLLWMWKSYIQKNQQNGM